MGPVPGFTAAEERGAFFLALAVRETGFRAATTAEAVAALQMVIRNRLSPVALAALALSS